MECIDIQILKNGTIRGVVLGAIILILSVFLFYFQVYFTSSIFTGFLFGSLVFGIFIPLILMIIFCYSLRRSIGGYWSLGQANTGIFIMFIVGRLVLTSGDTFFATVIEPHRDEKLSIAAKNGAIQVMKDVGMKQEEIKRMDDKHFIKRKNDSFSPGKVFLQVVMIAFISFIFALCYKKLPPYYTLS